MKKIYYAIMVLLAVVQSCNVEPEYYSQISPETFFDSQARVEQRFNSVFSNLAANYDYGWWSYFCAAGALSCDETLMPARGQDWYDGGYYADQYFHHFSPETDGEWYYIWDGYSGAIAQTFAAVEDIETNVDFAALGFSDPEGTRESMSNQLKVLIANYYLVALDAFGGVPLYTSNREELKARSSDKETFEYIEKLLTEALPTLPKRVLGERNSNKITQGIAAALLARLYLNAEPYIQEDMYDKCAQICQDILDGKYGAYRLANRFQDIFGFTNDACDEHVWAIASENGKKVMHGDQPWSMHYNTLRYLDNPEVQAWNGLCLTPSQDINGKHYRYEAGNLGGPFKLGCPYDKFEDSDLRKKNYLYLGGGEYEGMFLQGKLINRLTGDACVADGSREYQKGDTVAMVDIIAQLAPDIPPSEDEPNGRIRYPDGRKEGSIYGEENSGVRLFKLSPIPNAADNAIRYNSDWPIIRLAEIQYTLAECKFRKGDKSTAAGLINDVRKRYFEGGNDPNPVPATFDEYRLLDEWLIEFIGEGRRRTDLIRWNKYTTEDWWDHEADNKPHYNRFPIPAGILGTNSLLQQNPGY